MSSQVSIHITGIAEIRAKLTPEAFRKTLMGALRAALQPVASATSALAPQRTGAMARTVRVRLGTRGGALSAAIVTGVRYGHLVEYGHRIVTGGRAKPRRFVPLSQRGRFTGHVGGTVPPHPFARPAFAAQQGTIVETIERRLTAALVGSHV